MTLQEFLQLLHLLLKACHDPLLCCAAHAAWYASVLEVSILGWAMAVLHCRLPSLVRLASGDA